MSQMLKQMLKHPESVYTDYHANQSLTYLLQPEYSTDGAGEDDARTHSDLSCQARWSFDTTESCISTNIPVLPPVLLFECDFLSTSLFLTPRETTLSLHGHYSVLPPRIDDPREIVYFQT